LLLSALSVFISGEISFKFEVGPAGKLSTRRKTAKLLALRLEDFLEDGIRQGSLVGRRFKAPGKPVDFRVLRFTGTTGDERIAACAAAVGRRGALKTATAPAESGPLGTAAAHKVVSLRRQGLSLGQKVREHALDRVVRHQVMPDDRSGCYSLGTGVRGGGNGSHRRQKKNHKQCFSHRQCPSQEHKNCSSGRGAGGCEKWPFDAMDSRFGMWASHTVQSARRREAGNAHEECCMAAKIVGD